MSARSIRRNHERAEAQERRRSGRRGKRAGLATAAAIGASVVLTSPAVADNFEVDSTDDPVATDDCATDDCTLREAVQDANSLPGADTITFADALSGTITLAQGELDITDEAGVAITDAGVNEVTISGNDDTRIFNVDYYAGLSIDGLSLTQGFGEGGYQFPIIKYGGGGAILANYGSTVDVTSSDLYDNYAEILGGAISSQGATVTITGSTITGNLVGSGGGSGPPGAGGGVSSTGIKYDPPVAAAGGDRAPGEASLTIVGSTISGNGAAAAGGVLSSGDKYEAFGGISDASSDLDPSLVTTQITDSQITENEASFGGGSFSFYADTTVAATEITGNDSQAIGGIGTLFGPLNIDQSTISGNDGSDFAGGVSAKYGELQLSNSTVSENSSKYGGGVVMGSSGDVPFYYQTGDSVIEKTTIAGNSAEESGGGLAIGGVAPDASTTIVDSTISGNVAEGEAVDGYGYGGGIAVADVVYGDLAVSNSTVSGNTARVGGGISFDYAYDPDETLVRSGDEVVGDGSISVSNTTVADNEATDVGGGLYLGYYYDSEAEDDVRSTIALSSTVVGDNTANGSANDLGQVAQGTGGGVLLDRSLVETPGDVSVTQDPAGASIVGSDPALGDLADNGGPTQTHLPGDSSPLIDIGIANGLTTDQRGQGRTNERTTANGAGDGTDIGSVELPGNAGPVNTRDLLSSEVPAGCGTPFDQAALKIAGDASSQTLQGGEGDDLLRGFGGDDSVIGAGGDDCVTGDDGTDVVTGDDGSDYADGGNGTDRVTGNDGDDEVRGAGGEDLVKGQDGDDQVVGGGGEDKVVGAAGEDNARGRFGDDSVSGGADDDTVRGGGGNDKVNGGSGDDKMRGGGGDDLLILGKGANDVNCGKGEDEVKGATPDDEIPKNCETVG